MESARCKAFLAAVASGSLSKAAEELNYTPSGVSQLVTALEEEFGFPLLKRSKKGVSLTPEGESLLPAVSAYIRQERRIYQLAAEVKGLDIGSITIAAYSSIATHWLPKVIANFRRDYPNIRIKLLEGVRQEVKTWLAEGRADIGFLSDGDDVESEYHWIPLGEDPMVAVLPLDHEYADKDSYPLERCRYEHFIMPAMGRDDDVMVMLGKYGIEPHIEFSTIESFSAYAMIAEGMGMSITNSLILEGMDFDIVKVPVEPAQSITLGIALHSIEHASPAVRKFVQYAVRQLKA